ncbi:hypothetical protein BRADI_3g17513v3 [Brachypodium distachyon]|uniref:Uncharacterized protein n=1 Tax=Brachypodium distachyon TaxID=15368 RepID=A0A2K2CXT7_BRADI|nr:hypothetical protein BRADI_3g17513v3 [Brachypodium distachyon]
MVARLSPLRHHLRLDLRSTRRPSVFNVGVLVASVPSRGERKSRVHERNERGKLVIFQLPKSINRRTPTHIWDGWHLLEVMPRPLSSQVTRLRLLQSSSGQASRPTLSFRLSKSLDVRLRFLKSSSGEASRTT